MHNVLITTVPFGDKNRAPTKKVNSIMDIVKKYPISLESSVMIGDSIDDYRAAKANNLPFVLRRTKLNKKLQLDLKCKMIYNFQ